ncbi:MAG: hypothetical protein WBA74_12460 [Cyclobacteriaceae bacterium]
MNFFEKYDIISSAMIIDLQFYFTSKQLEQLDTEHFLNTKLYEYLENINEHNICLFTKIGYYIFSKDKDKAIDEINEIIFCNYFREIFGYNVPKYVDSFLYSYNKYLRTTEYQDNNNEDELFLLDSLYWSLKHNNFILFYNNI